MAERPIFSCPASRFAGGVLALVLLGSCQREGPEAEPQPFPVPPHRSELVELLREELAAEPHPADGGGRAWLASQEPEVVEAGGRGRWTILYEAGPHGIAPGGTLLLQVSPFWGWSTPQVEEPEALGFTTVETGAEGVELAPATLDRQLLGIRIEGRKLEPGERVRIVYGAGEARARADRFAERETRLWIGVDGDGDGRRKLLAASPRVDIAPGPAALVLAHLPSSAEPGDSIPLALAVVDRFGNAGVDFTGELRLASSQPGLELPQRVRLRAADGAGRRLEARAAREGVFRVLVEGPEGMVAESNPMAVSPGAARILWGDLHGHSHFSDGTGVPEDYFRYARDVAALDVVALTDHDHWGLQPLAQSEERWSEIRHQVQSFHEAHRFVTLLGYEWTSWRWGHRHVLYFADDGPIFDSVDPRYDSPERLWAALRGREALTFAHHSAGGPIAIDWNVRPDPELEPVTEIVSVHGSSEAADSPAPIYGAVPGNWVRDVLEGGYRLGLVGSGDSHDGHPGMAHLASASGGLAAILSDELTREGVLEALRERRVYATNGPRILLRAALDGARMGSLLPATEGHTLQVIVVAVTPLERVDLIRGRREIESLPAGGERFFSLERDLGPTRPGDFLYVRAVQTDGGAAWSSPFFFE